MYDIINKTNEPSPVFIVLSAVGGPKGKIAGFMVGIIGNNWDSQERTFDVRGASLDVAISAVMLPLKFRPVIGDFVKKYLRELLDCDEDGC